MKIENTLNRRKDVLPASTVVREKMTSGLEHLTYEESRRSKSQVKVKH